MLGWPGTGQLSLHQPWHPSNAIWWVSLLLIPCHLHHPVLSVPCHALCDCFCIFFNNLQIKKTVWSNKHIIPTQLGSMVSFYLFSSFFVAPTFHILSFFNENGEFQFDFHPVCLICPVFLVWFSLFLLHWPFTYSHGWEPALLLYCGYGHTLKRKCILSYLLSDIIKMVK